MLNYRRVYVLPKSSIFQPSSSRFPTQMANCPTGTCDVPHRNAKDPGCRVSPSAHVRTHRIHGAAIYGNIYHEYTPNVSIYTIHGYYGELIEFHLVR